MTAASEPSTQAPPAPLPQPPTSKPGRARRWLRAIALGVSCLFGLAFAVLVGLRLYYSDARLTAMAQAWLSERSGGPVELRAIETSLTHGVEVRGLVIGALPGFRAETVRLGRLALHWSFWDLFRLRAV